MYVWLDKTNQCVGYGPGPSTNTEEHTSVPAEDAIRAALLENPGLIHRIRQVRTPGGESVLRILRPLITGRTSVLRLHRNRQVDDPDITLTVTGEKLVVGSPHDFGNAMFISYGQSAVDIDTTFPVYVGEQDLFTLDAYALSLYPFVYLVGAPLRWRAQLIIT